MFGVPLDRSIEHRAFNVLTQSGHAVVHVGPDLQARLVEILSGMPLRLKD
jgi:hypothetical protein